ncbi:MAG: hypothetical protein A3H93_09185 [Rhodocyclales bacterium RIFCSPLOWO2_02_FULL_63_24]|nr:MAG: hypothetical protein A3H93_09185 [Rhodocyclales bacterium RIFCSPLOWO2_02_FULL_63_24]
MIDDDRKRRNSLLASLAFAGGASVARELRDELESVHNVPATLDRVRADLRVLADIGALRLEGDRVMLTAEGREHVDRLRALF